MWEYHCSRSDIYRVIQSTGIAFRKCLQVGLGSIGILGSHRHAKEAQTKSRYKHDYEKSFEHVLPPYKVKKGKSKYLKSLRVVATTEKTKD
jgi:hypothetical protein